MDSIKEFPDGITPGLRTLKIQDILEPLRNTQGRLEPFRIPQDQSLPF